MTVKEKTLFFSRENFHRAGWTLIGAIVVGVFGWTYSKIYGPTRVVLDTSSAGTPVQVTVQPQVEPAVSTDIKALTSAVENLQKKVGSTSENDRITALTKEV